MGVRGSGVQGGLGDALEVAGAVLWLVVTARKAAIMAMATMAAMARRSAWNTSVGVEHLRCLRCQLPSRTEVRDSIAEVPTPPVGDQASDSVLPAPVGNSRATSFACT